MKLDSYNEVINHADTYSEIAGMLIEGRSVLIGWTDEQGSHFDILFNVRPHADLYNARTIQRGIRVSDLIVSIMSRGAFGFEINSADIAAGYYGEKLNLGGGITTDKLAELLNGVKKEIDTFYRGIEY